MENSWRCHEDVKKWISEVGEEGGQYLGHYIILNNGILKSNSSVFPRSKGYISQYTPEGVYWLIVHEINEVNIILLIVKMILCPY